MNDKVSFTGTTRFFAFTDTHLDTRKTRAILSRVFEETSNENKNNSVVLYGGDMFKGVYPKDLEKDSYIKFKEACPDVEVVMTLGNNDFGFTKTDINYLINCVKEFAQKGIKVVCANIFDAKGKRPNWLKPYTVIERDGDRTFISGFCIDNINTARFGIEAKPQEEVMQEIIEAIEKEKPDNVAFLNHDYMPKSRILAREAEKSGTKIDFTIGGHDHDHVLPDEDLRIYYPQAFGKSMYTIELSNNDLKKSLSAEEEMYSIKSEVLPFLEQDLLKYENKVGLYNPIVPKVLNLIKSYSRPCALGSFLADAIKKTTKSDISFFSTGFLMEPMPYRAGEYVTKYSFMKTIAAETPIKTVELSVKDLKNTLQHSLNDYGKRGTNAKFLQVSNNVKIEGMEQDTNWQIRQIYVDNEPLLDKDLKPLDPNKKFKCAMDAYIADGGQGYSMLKELPKEEAHFEDTGEIVKINEVLMNALKEAPGHYTQGGKYPSYQIISMDDCYYR